MKKLVAIVFENEAKAEEVRDKVTALGQEYLIEVSDAAIAVKTEKGIKLNQIINTTAAGAASGSIWGLLIGVLFFAPLAGVLAGTAGGALGGYLSDVGVDNKFMKRLADGIENGQAVLFVQFSNATEDKVLEEVKGLGGELLQTSLTADAEAKLRQALAA